MLEGAERITNLTSLVLVTELRCLARGHFDPRHRGSFCFSLSTATPFSFIDQRLLMSVSVATGMFLLPSHCLELFRETCAYRCFSLSKHATDKQRITGESETASVKFAHHGSPTCYNLNSNCHSARQSCGGNGCRPANHCSNYSNMVRPLATNQCLREPLVSIFVPESLNLFRPVFSRQSTLCCSL